MSATCGRVGALLDGRLSREEAADVRAHLATCDACARELSALMMLEVVAREHGPALREAKHEEKQAKVVSIGRARRLRPVALAGLLLPAAAAAAWALYARRADHDDAPIAMAAPLLTSRTRSLEARLAYEPVDRYRPYDVARAVGEAPGEPLPLDALARLDKAGDAHGVGALLLLSGDPDRARPFLDKAARSLGVDSDRAAAALARGRYDDALDGFDAVLAKKADHPQALFDRALTLRELGLARAAAETFDRVAALGEPGWADEARARATRLRAEADEAARAWAAAKDAGVAMVSARRLPPAEVVRAFPTYLRHYLYHAVRSARTREEVLALAPLAEDLDRVEGAHVLADYVRAISTRDLARRAPLAATYAALVAAPLPPDAARAFLESLRSAGESDMLLGAIALTGELPSRIDEYERLAEGRGDAWFRTIADGARAQIEFAKGEQAAAERRLRDGIAACEAHRLDYRCAVLELDLANLLARMHRLPEAQAVATHGLARSTTHAFELAWSFLFTLGDVARLRGTFAPMRAYLREAELARPEHCATRRATHELLADARVATLDFAGARAELEKAPRCDQAINLVRADDLATLLRSGFAPPEEVARIDADLAAVRANLGPGERAFLDVIAGRIALARGSAVAASELRRAIDAGHAAGRADVSGQKAVAFARRTLAVEAARAGDADGALAEIMTLGDAATPPRGAEPCVLGVAVDDERRVAVARGVDGAATVDLDAHRASPALDPEALVPVRIRDRLRACAEVRVYAMPPVQGTPSLLPVDVAWSYASSPPAARAAVTASAPERRVVVSDVEPPAALALPRLSGWTPPGPGVTWLHGASATPSRVLDALATATEVEIHAHGYVDQARSDASLLVLSGDAAGRFALTAGDIRGHALHAHPVVVLGACHAGETAPYLHEAWSLPNALVAAGARAVLASPSIVDDAEALAFFEAVLARIRAGEVPSRALRDERVARLARDPQSWVTAINVFE